MSEVEQMTAMDRRFLLRSAILLVGGSIAGLPSVALAQENAGDGARSRFFTPAQFAVLAEYADLMIPRTDTPGAKDAGVPDYFDSLMSNWASEDRRDGFRTLIEEIGGAGLLSRPPAERLALAKQIDAKKLEAGDPTYAKFKELILTLYYLSEAGATQELRYELVPGKWEPGTTMSSDTRAWAV